MSRRRRRRVPLAPTAARLRLLLVLVAMTFSLTAVRAVQVQVVDAKAVALEASKSMTRVQEVLPDRGSITDRSGAVLAFTEATVNVTADPRMISTNGKEEEAVRDADRVRAAEAPAELARIVARHTGEDAGLLEARLRRSGDRYALLARQVPESTYQKIAADVNAGKWVGIFKEPNPRRVYPMGTVASNVVGYMVDGVGLGGVEYARQGVLAGTKGREQYETSPNGRIPLGTQMLEAAVDGSDVRLTIDADMQWMVEQRLAEQVKAKNGVWGVAVVLDVESGELLSLANYPSFDSNDQGKAKPADLGNRAVGTVYEPGSVQKVLTISSLLDAGVTTPDSPVSIDQTIKVGDGEVSDAVRHGPITYTTRGVLAKSSNVGAITLARSMPKQQFRDYMLGFGLGTKTALGLPGEATGAVPPANMPDYQRDSMAFGYGLSVTPVQMAAAVAAVANDGVWTAPSLVAATRAPDGTVTPTAEPETRRVVSPDAARETLAMMEQMVLLNPERLEVPGYRTGAKTGTARLAVSGGYRGQVASIVGVAPVEDPQILVYVLIARKDQLGAGLGTAGPAYRDIMSLALPRYGVRPSGEKMDTLLPLTR